MLKLRVVMMVALLMVVLAGCCCGRGWHGGHGHCSTVVGGVR